MRFRAVIFVPLGKCEEDGEENWLSELDVFGGVGDGGVWE